MTSTDPMKNDGLLLGKNEVGMGWCLERLRGTAHSRPNARDLAIFQAVPIYYSSLSVKREVKMTSAKRHAESAKAYKFSAMAYLSYLMEQHEFRTPEWLTRGVMGRRTLTGKDAKYYDETSGAAWRRYQEIVRTFRNEWVPWVNRYKVSSASSEGALPSGTQEADMWQALHEFLFEHGPGAVRKMKRSEYEERKDAENLELVVDAVEKGDSVGPPVPAEDRTDDNLQTRSSDHDSSPQSASAAGDPTTPDVVQDNDATPDEGTSDAPEEFVRVKKLMPQNWLHSFSLAFACFGPFADHQDPDLDLKLSDGPIDADNPASVAPNSESGQGVAGKESKPLTGRVFADERLSRTELKKRKLEEALGGRQMGPRKVIVERDEASKESEKNIISCLNGMRDEFKAANKMRAEANKQREVSNKQREVANKQRQANLQLGIRREKISQLQDEIKLLNDIGSVEEAAGRKQDLLDLLRSPVEPPSVEVTRADSPWGGSGTAPGSSASSKESRAEISELHALHVASVDAEVVGCEGGAGSAAEPLDVDLEYEECTTSRMIL